MAEDVLDIILRLSNLQRFVAGTREAATGVAEIGTASKKSTAESATMGSRMSGVAGIVKKSALGFAAAAVGIGYESTKMSIESQKQMEMIHTQAGDSQRAVAVQSNRVLGMAGSGQFAQGPIELAKGLFHLESIGLRAGKAISALKLASQGAAVGNANLEDTTTALGAAWLTGIRGAGNLKTVMAALNATVGAGNMRMQSLVESLGTGVLPASKIAGLHLRDVMSALALLSDEGYQGSSAMAQFATSLHFLYDPTTKAAGALKTLGLQPLALANQIRKGGLFSTLKLLHDRLARFKPTKATQLMGDILPGGRGRVLEVLLNNFERLRKKQNQIGANTKNWSDDVSKTQQTAAFKIHAAWAMIQADLIRLGRVLQPVAVFFAQGIAKVAGWLLTIPKLVHNIIYSPSGGLTGFGKFIMQIGNMATHVFNGQFVQSLISIGRTIFNVMKTVGNALLSIGRMALPGFISMFRGAFNVIAGIVNFVAAILTGRFGRAFHFLGQIASGFFNTFKGAIMVILAPIRFVAGLIWSLISGAFNKVLGFVKSVPGRIGAFFSGLGGIINGIFSSIVNDIISALNWVIGAINKVISGFNSVAGLVPGVDLTVGKIGTITPLGPSTTNTAAPVRRIAPRAANTAGRPGTGAPGVTRQFAMTSTARAPMNPLKIEVPVIIHGKEVARAVGKITEDKVARR